MDRLETAAAPITAAEFARQMDSFAPFKSAPHLAVAVSGGADSLALALLAADWARARGGRITALTVNHGLRAEAAAEAAQVADWLGARGIVHQTLRHEGARPQADIQAKARALRYRLLEDWCARHGVLHLLTAHHREDQAETLLLRLARGSGLDGLAGMAPTVERAACRVLRPLLFLARHRLRATLDAARQGWIEDPSNRDPAYARVRLRQGMTLLAAEGLTTDRLAATAGRLARARLALESAIATLLAQAVTLDDGGFALIEPSLLVAAPDEIGLRALAAVLATVGGAEFPPRLERLARLYRLLPAGLAGGRTLGGCRLLPRRSGLLVCREPAALAAPVPVEPGTIIRWDGRFTVTLPATAPRGLSLGALGDELGRIAPVAGDGARRVPGAARAALPAIRDAKGVVAVPSLGYFLRWDNKAQTGFRLDFRPTRPLMRAGFTVV